MSKITKRTRQKIKMIFITVLTFVTFITEITIGYWTNSLALISDSYNMISDLVSLIIGLVCLWLSTKESKKNTYGWARVEIWSALVNSVCGIALCFSIFTDAIQRLVTPEKIDQADLVLIMGGIGLAVNLIGVFTFLDETFEGCIKKGNDEEANEGKSQTLDKGHILHSSFKTEKSNLSKDGYEVRLNEFIPDNKNHYSDKFQESSETRFSVDVERPTQTDSPITPDEKSSSGMDIEVSLDDSSTTNSSQMVDLDDKCLDGPLEEVGQIQSEDELDIMTSVAKMVTGSIEEEEVPRPDPKKEKTKKIKSGNQMNIQGVFLHLLSDALGSVAVIVSGVINKIYQEEWTTRVDPALSLLIVIVIVASTIPLIKQSSNVLLQRVPKNVKVSSLMVDLNNEVRGITNVHDFHVWQLVGSRLIASLHMRCSSLPEYIAMSKKIKKFFHENGIHSTTIQPEFMEHQDKPTNRECFLECGPDLKCHEDTCCCTKKTKQKKISTASTVSGLSIQSALSTDTAISIDSDLGGTTLI